MDLTNREWWTLVHGMILGAFFLLAFTGGLAELYGMRSEQMTPEGLRGRLRRLKIGMSAMAITAWLTVITGTWIVYPWYREKLAGEEAAGCEGAQAPGDECSPRDFLLSNVSGNTEDWHKFGMEWKEHIAWLSPMLATVAAFLAIYYGATMAQNRYVRLLVTAIFIGAFVTAAIAGLYGALITKVAPVT
jgi:hypothetical protein